MITLPFDVDALLDALLLGLAPETRVSILDSCEARGRDRFLIAAFDPVEVIEVFPNTTRVHLRNRNTEQSFLAPITDALEHVEIRLEAFRAQLEACNLATSKNQITDDAPNLAAQINRLPVNGGACIVTLAYEFAHTFLDLRLTPKHSPANHFEPLATFAFYDWILVYDYETKRTFLSSIAGDARLEIVADTLQKLVAQTTRQTSTRLQTSTLEALETNAPPTSNFTAAAYCETVETIKQHILAGDIYQANLTQSFTCDLPFGLTPEKIFRRLRQSHPATHAAFLRRTEDAVISISPERFLRVELDDKNKLNEKDKHARTISAVPIKGTRARGANIEEDKQLKHELLTSAKDRAENIMIVDLLRNDLGRVCEYGSVEAVDVCRIAQHPTLFHLVSTIRGRLKIDAGIAEIIRVAFPCGSITGAPKLRAMEIIHALEPDARNLSMGTIGYLAFDGTLDLSVAIRTMTISNHTARFNTGGGITADSLAIDEYEESMLKARALFQALGFAELESRSGG